MTLNHDEIRARAAMTPFWRYLHETSEVPNWVMLWLALMLLAVSIVVLVGLLR